MWQEAEYIIAGNLTIAENATLGIETGTIIKMQGLAKIIVNGTINAVGTENDKIVITNVNDSDYGGTLTNNEINDYWGRFEISSSGEVHIMQLGKKQVRMRENNTYQIRMLYHLAM